MVEGGPDRRPDRRLAGRAHHAHPVEGLPPRPVQGLRPHLPHPDGGGARHLRRARHQGGDQCRRSQPVRARRPGPPTGRPARVGGVGRPRRGRRPPPPDRLPPARRAPPRPPRHRPAPERGDRRGGDGQRLPRRLAHRRGPRRRGRRGGLPPDHRRLPGGRTGGLAPRLGGDRLGPPGRSGGGRTRHRVRSAGDRRQLRLLHRGQGRRASRVPHRRGGRGRLGGHHQAPRYRRRGVGRDGHRPAALRDRRAPLRQHRRGRPVRHHPARRGGHRPGAGVGGTRRARPRGDQGLPQPARRLAQHHDLRAHRSRHRGEGGPHRPLPGRRAGPGPSARSSTSDWSARTSPMRRPTPRPRPPCG